MEHNNPIKLRRVTRIGVYGIAIVKGRILLIEKQQGCYKGLWDLPGGGIEFGETSEDALHREIREEVAMKFKSMQLIGNVSHTREVVNIEDPFHFHHLGQLYILSSLSEILEGKPEERFAWHSLSEISINNLTPFAQEGIQLFLTGKSHE